MNQTTFKTLKDLRTYVKGQVVILENTDDHNVHFETCCQIEDALHHNAKLVPNIVSKMNEQENYTIVDAIDEVIKCKTKSQK